MHPIALSLYALTLAAPNGTTDTLRARSIVTAAARAVEADSAAAVRRRELARSAGNTSDPIAMLRLATISRLSYDYAAADLRYRALLAGPATRPFALYACLGLGLSLAARWNLAAAGPHLTRAAAEATSLGDASAEVEALTALARMVGRAGMPDSSRALFARVGALLPVSDSALTAVVTCLRGGAARQTSVARAESLLAVGHRLADQAGASRARGLCLFVEAQVAEVKGTLRRAIDLLGAALDTLRGARDLNTYAAAAQFQAYLLTKVARFDRTRGAAADAIAAGRRSGNVLAAAWAGLNLAQVALRLGDFAEASRAAQRSLGELEALGDLSGIASARFVIGDAALLGGRLDEARRSFELADSSYGTLGLTAERPGALYRLAVVAREQGRAPLAAALLDSALGVAAKIGARAWLDVDGRYELGMQALARGDAADAARHFDAFRVAAGPGAVHYHYDALVRTAEAQAKAGGLAQAHNTLEAAFHSAARVNDYTSDREAQIGVLSGRRFDLDPDLGFATIVDRFAAAGHVEEALQISESRRARILGIQALRRLALARDSARAAAVRWGVVPDSVTLEALQRRIPDSTAALVFVTGRGGEPTTLFGVERARLWSARLTPADSLVTPIARFGAAVEAGGTGGALAGILGSALLGEVARRLGADVSRLVVVADGPLHRLPFDALQLKDGRLVLDRFTVTLAPSLAHTLLWWSRPMPLRPGRVIAFGDPHADAAGLPRLPGSRAEARAAAAALPRGAALLGRDASERTLESLDYRDVRVLHLATHARVEDWGIFNSALFLSPGDGEDGRVGAEEIAQLHLDTEIVVLSGCRTLGGVVVTGEGLQGLVAPFLEAGARSVVATYWDVRDDAADQATLVRSFYANLRRGASAADALRGAKLASKRAGASPNVWANVAVYGDGSVRPLAAVSAAR